ncbi:MAG: hydroxyacid dehydrogenase [Candidatus Jordarchaeales archaeon]
MGRTVVVLDPIHASGIELIQKAGFNVIEAYDSPPNAVEEFIKNADVVIVRSRTKVTRSLIEKAPHLKLIARCGVGLDNIDLKAAEERGICVINSPESSAVSVAELTIGLILSLLRMIPLADRSMKDGKWLKKELEGTQFYGKTLGIIGFGRIGQAVAERALAFGAKIIAYDVDESKASIAKKMGITFVSGPGSLEFLLRNSDIVSLHVPLSEETRKLIGPRELELMKPGSYLVNTARGGLIDEEALYQALKSGKLAGAALDVFSEEPPKNKDLISLPNVICTPHIGASTYECQLANAVEIAQKIVDFFKSERNA